MLCFQNMSDAMAVLPKLSTGLDVNVRFTGVTDFEYTPECIVFDLLDIPLYHGWLVDPQVHPHLEELDPLKVFESALNAVCVKFIWAHLKTRGRLEADPSLISSFKFIMVKITSIYRPTDF